VLKVVLLFTCDIGALSGLDALEEVMIVRIKADAIGRFKVELARAADLGVAWSVQKTKDIAIEPTLVATEQTVG
jgi:hypothetical protein